MELYELNWLLPNIELASKLDMERMRFQCYITAQTQSTKKLKPTDIMQFSWDNKVNEKIDAPSLEDKQRLIEKMKLITNKNI